MRSLFTKFVCWTNFCVFVTHLYGKKFHQSWKHVSLWILWDYFIVYAGQHSLKHNCLYVFMCVKHIHIHIHSKKWNNTLTHTTIPHFISCMKDSHSVYTKANEKSTINLWNILPPVTVQLIHAFFSIVGIHITMEIVCSSEITTVIIFQWYHPNAISCFLHLKFDSMLIFNIPFCRLFAVLNDVFIG